MKLSLGITPRDYSVAGAVTYDADALAYFTANTAITSAADKNAINTFYLGLKSDGIYTKIKAMYLPIWGSAASSKWNLKDPRDLDAAFRLTFTTGWTYSSSGITPNGTSAYANTNLTPSTAPLTLNNTHLSFYSRTTGNLGNVDIGQLWVNGGAQAYGLYSSSGRNTDNNMVAANNSSDANRIIVAQTNASGLFVNTRTSTSSFKYFQNNILKGSNSNINTSVYQGLGQNSILLSALNYFVDTNVPQNQIINYSAKQCSFASIGDGLTDAQVTNFYTRVNTLMTYFGINV